MHHVMCAKASCLLTLASVSAGINLVGLDGTLYDQVLDTIFYLGLAPARFSVRPLSYGHTQS